MKIKSYIFNYCRYFESLELLTEFQSRNIESKIINCHCSHLPEDEMLKSNDNFISLPNLGYSGQWNAMLNDLNDEDDIILITNSDVMIPKIDLLLERMKKFYSFENSGMYAPNVRWMSWNFCKKMLEKIDDFHIVPSTDSVIWSLRKEIAFEIGQIDLEKNKWGWGIEVLASYYCNLKNKLVVRDYNVVCKHKKETLYGRPEAESQQKEWFNSFNFSDDLWKHYYSRYDYGFDRSGILMS